MNFLENSGKALTNMGAYGAYLTAGYDGKINPMTIGWGQIGISQGKSVFCVMVRQSRYTKELLDKNPVFTVSVPFDASHKASLAFCGSKSGRDFDKIKECNLETVPSKEIDVPGISGCMVYECRVIYKTEMSKEETCPEFNEKWYKNGDYHTVYTGEILNYKEN